MRRLRVQCVNRAEKGPLKGKVERIGGFNENGEKWNISVEEAVKGTQSGLWEFFVVKEKLELNIDFSANDEGLFEALTECPW